MSKVKPGYAVDAARVRPVVQAWLDEYRLTHSGKTNNDDPGRTTGGVEALAFQTGLGERSIVRLCADPDTTDRSQKTVPIETLDKLLIAMGRMNMLYVHPDPSGDGTDGYADVYFHPDVVGSHEDEVERLREEYAAGLIDLAEFEACVGSAIADEDAEVAA